MLSTAAEQYFALFEKCAAERQGTFADMEKDAGLRSMIRHPFNSINRAAHADRLAVRGGVELASQAGARRASADTFAREAEGAEKSLGALKGRLEKSEYAKHMQGLNAQPEHVRNAIVNRQQAPLVQRAEAAEARAVAAEKAQAAAASQPAATAQAGGSRVPWVLGTLGATGAGVGGSYAAYNYGQGQGQKKEHEDNKYNRALAFGGGVASGLAAPRILQGVNQLVRNQGLMPGYGGGYKYQGL